MRCKSYRFNVIYSERQKNQTAPEVKEIKNKAALTYQDMKKFYDFDKYDTDYLTPVVRLFSSVAPSANISTSPI